MRAVAKAVCFSSTLTQAEQQDGVWMRRLGLRILPQHRRKSERCLLWRCRHAGDPRAKTLLGHVVATL